MEMTCGERGEELSCSGRGRSRAHPKAPGKPHTLAKNQEKTPGGVRDPQLDQVSGVRKQTPDKAVDGWRDEWHCSLCSVSLRIKHWQPVGRQVTSAAALRHRMLLDTCSFSENILFTHSFFYDSNITIYFEWQENQLLIYE